MQEQDKRKQMEQKTQVKMLRGRKNRKNKKNSSGKIKKKTSANQKIPTMHNAKRHNTVQKGRLKPCIRVCKTKGVIAQLAEWLRARSQHVQGAWIEPAGVLFCSLCKIKL